MDNQEYDKVLVKLDGSGRLTTRNRRFVKKIVSPPDPAQTGVPHAQSVDPVNDDDAIPASSGDIVPGPIIESGMVTTDMSVDQVRHDNQGDEVGGIIQNEVSDIVSNDDPVQNGRPKRNRKQNVKYSSQEYDLSNISIHPGTPNLKLSSIYVQQKSGKLMKKMMNQRV